MSLADLADLNDADLAKELQALNDEQLRALLSRTLRELFAAIRQERSVRGRIGALTAQQRRAFERLPSPDIIEVTRLSGELEKARQERERLLSLRRKLGRLLGKILAEFRRRKRPRLFQFHIRIYNEARPGDETPKGSFQAFYLFDAVMVPETGEPDLSFQFSMQEIQIAKQDMIQRFQWGVSAERPGYSEQQLLTGFLEDAEGIASAEQTVGKIAKVPEELRGELTIEELVVGMSSQMPEPEDDPQGVFLERLIVIKENQIIWDSGIFEPPKGIFPAHSDFVQQVKKEMEERSGRGGSVKPT